MIEFKGLLEDLRNYSPEPSNLKARKVYRKLLKAKKYALAEKVYAKYLKSIQESDRVVAFGLMIMSGRK